MANSKIDFSTITSFIPEAVQELGAMIKEAAFTHSDLNRIITVMPGVDWEKKIGYYGKLTDIGKKAASGACSINEVTASVATTEKDWDPQPWDTRLAICADDINNTIAAKALKKGIFKYDLTDTEYFALFEVLLAEAIVEMFNRFVWFGDKDAAHTDDSPAGYITPAKDLDMINVNDGLFKKAYTIIAAAPAQRVEITANAAANYAAQNSGLSAATALTIVQNMKLNAPLELRQALMNGGYAIYCTLKFYDKVAANFKSFELESMKVALENGVEALKIDGLQLIAVPEWDHLINAWENSGTKWRDPYRAILMSKDNAVLGIPALDVWGEYDVWYEKKDKKVYIDMKDKYDTLWLQDSLIMFAV